MRTRGQTGSLPKPSVKAVGAVARKTRPQPLTEDEKLGYVKAILRNEISRSDVIKTDSRVSRGILRNWIYRYNKGSFRGKSGRPRALSNKSEKELNEFAKEAIYCKDTVEFSAKMRELKIRDAQEMYGVARERIEKMSQSTVERYRKSSGIRIGKAGVEASAREKA